MRFFHSCGGLCCYLLRWPCEVISELSSLWMVNGAEFISLAAASFISVLLRTFWTSCLFSAELTIWNYICEWSRGVGLVSSKRSEPRDAVLRGVRVEKKQVNSHPATYCVSDATLSGGSVQFTGVKCEFRKYSLSCIRRKGRQPNKFSLPSESNCNIGAGFWSVLPVIYFHPSGLQACL